MWVVLMVLASCQDATQDPKLTEVVPATPDYPSLHTVPPRPQLSYPVEQRRAIVDGLIADRENARYSNQVVRYRTGLSGLPPPATPPVAAAPLTPAPDIAAAGEVSPAPDRERARPAAPPETQFDRYDDDLDSFLEDMADEDGERPGAAVPGPASNAAPVGRAIVRAGAAWSVGPPAADQHGPAPAAVWAVPAKTAGLPTASSVTRTRGASSAPARVGTSLASRAPGVVWGMVDMPDRPAGRIAASSTAQAAEASRAAASPAREPVAPASIDRPPSAGQSPQRTQTVLAGRAPGVVWGMVDMPNRPAEPAAPTIAAPVADVSAASISGPPVADQPASAPPSETGEETTGGDQNGVESAVTAMAERPELGPPSELPTDAAGIEIHDGLIAVSLAPSAAHTAPLASIGFAPGSAVLPPHATTHLKRFLVEVKAPEARIRVVGEADTPALALDRALAVGIALVQRGVPADRLDLTLAPDPGGDQVRLSALAPAP
jgi:hypothetical protein